jgi:hypothetical protein
MKRFFQALRVFWTVLRGGGVVHNVDIALDDFQVVVRGREKDLLLVTNNAFLDLSLSVRTHKWEYQ